MYLRCKLKQIQVLRAHREAEKGLFLSNNRFVKSNEVRSVNY